MFTLHSGAPDMITLFVVTTEYDPTIAGTLGDVEWNNEGEDYNGLYECYITTDNYLALAECLDNDDNVCSYTVVEEGE